MDFRILGSLEVLDDGRAIALPGTKPRALLALLLLHANETLTADRIIDELWGERPPAAAGKTLQMHVSRLRKALGGEDGTGIAGAITTRERGYRLEIDPDQLDAHRFESLVAKGRAELAAGRPDRAVAALEAALGLWHGAPLADLAYEAFAQPDIARLRDLRIAALEQLLEAKLALGRHAEVVEQLEPLIGEHPYREGLRAQLMLALYRCDRQADALQAYQDARRILVEELGIEPGERLRELERAILAQDAGLVLVTHEKGTETRAAPEGRRRAFVGRDRELAELVAALDDALASSGRLVLLAGEPGIGKSRLADALMEEARSRGAGVVAGRSWEAGGAPAYWPWIQALRAHLRDTEPSALRAQLGAGAASLAQLLPELRERFGPLPEPPALEGEGARFRLFEAVRSFLRGAAESRPLVVVFDDLHAADEPTLLLLRFVARELEHSRVMIVGAYRDVDPTLREPLTTALAELVREPQTSQIALTGLTAADVAEYVELSTGIEPAPDLVDAIHAETDGNALFISETVRLLAAEGEVDWADAHVRIPPGVRAVIGRRVARLSEPCRALLVPASVMGREFGVEALAESTELGPEELMDALNEAMAERVLDDVPGTPGRVRFGHVLIRDTLYDDLTAARRMQLHREVGEALETVYSSDPEPHLAELAQHFVAAAPIGTKEKAIEYARRAGDRAASQLAYEEAVRLFEMALTLVDETVARCELLLALGDARARGGDTPASKQAFHEAAELAESRGLAEHLAHAALGYGGRIIWEVSRDDQHLAPLLERALAALGEEESPLRVRLLARFAGGPLRDASFPPERKTAMSLEALEMARRMGDHAALAYALAGYIAAGHSPARTPEQLELATELVKLATEAGDLERTVEAYEHRLGVLLELGEVQRAKADLAAMAEAAEELRQPSQDWFVAQLRAHLALLEGRFADAEDLIERARSLGERAQSWSAAVSFRLQLFLLRREQGRLEEVEELVRRSANAYPTYRIWRCVLAHTAADLGHEAESRVAFEALAKDRLAALPFDKMWLASTSFLAETAKTLVHVRGAAILYEELLPFRDRVAAAPEFSTGAVARYLGLLAATMEGWDDAERHFEDALETNGRIGAQPWLAHTQEDYARMLLARGTADREKALELLAEALATYRELGMRPAPEISLEGVADSQPAPGKVGSCPPPKSDDRSSAS